MSANPRHANGVKEEADDYEEDRKQEKRGGKRGSLPSFLLPLRSVSFKKKEKTMTLTKLSINTRTLV